MSPDPCVRRRLCISGLDVDVTVGLHRGELYADIVVGEAPSHYVASTPDRLANSVRRVRPAMLAWVKTKHMEEVISHVREVAEDLTYTKGDEREMGQNIDSLIRAAYERRDEIVLCLLGAPGIGKTEAVERFARERGVRVTHLILSQVMPNEISGITMPVPETHSMSVFDNDRLASMEDGDILFLDEVLKAQQPVLSACLTLVQERRMMSGRKLPDVMIIAAANPLPSSATLPLEIRQRFMFVETKFVANEWLDYMLREHGVWMTDAIPYLDVSGEGTGWNSPTPRTVTKMVEWMRSVSDDERRLRSVRGFCQATFNGTLEQIIYDAVRRSREKEMMSDLAGIIDEVRGDVTASFIVDGLSFDEMRAWLRNEIKGMSDEEMGRLMERARDLDMSCLDEDKEEEHVEG